MHRRRFLRFSLLSAALATLVACTERFEVTVVNHRDTAVKVGIGQFHAPDFTTTPPDTFTQQELIKQEVLELAPGERRTLAYNSASGGFWLQWRMLEPLQEPSRLSRLDLLRDERTINLR